MSTRQYEKKSRHKNEGTSNKTYQESVAASECSRQHTRIWLDRSLDCILHSTNIETPCAQLNPRQRGWWNIRGVKSPDGKKGIAFAKSFCYKKSMNEEQVGKEEKYWHDAKCVDNFSFSLRCPHYVTYLPSYSQMAVLCQHCNEYYILPVVPPAFSDT